VANWWQCEVVQDVRVQLPIDKVDGLLKGRLTSDTLPDLARLGNAPSWPGTVISERTVGFWSSLWRAAPMAAPAITKPTRWYTSVMFEQCQPPILGVNLNATPAVNNDDVCVFVRGPHKCEG
jgi:hypothetical protein